MDKKMFNDILDAIINNATPEEIETIREKLNEHLINYDYDQRVAEDLSKKNDGSFCPHCDCANVIKFDKDKKR